MRLAGKERTVENNLMDVPPELAKGELIAEALLRRFLKRCGVGVKVFKRCRLFPPQHVAVGDYSQIDENVWVFAGQGVAIGKFTHLAFGSSISGGGECAIGDFVGIGAGVRLVTGTEIVDQGGLTNPTAPAHLRTVSRGHVSIRDHAVVFTNSVVFPNVEIGEGAVVSAGSIVHHDLKPWTIYGGNPLVAIGIRDRDEVLHRAGQLLAETAALPVNQMERNLS